MVTTKYRLRAGEGDDRAPHVGLGGPTLQRWLLALTIGLTVASVAVQLSYHVLGHGGLLGANEMFDMTQEGNAPTWFATVLLLACSVVLGLLAAHSRLIADGHARWWAGFAALFAAASLDEAAGIHEAVGFALGDAVFGYLIPGTLILLVVGFGAREFIAALPRGTRRALAVGLGVWAFGAIGLEIVEAAFWPGDHRPRLGLSLLGTAQDLFELLGVVFILSALLDHSAEIRARLTVQVTR